MRPPSVVAHLTRNAHRLAAPGVIERDRQELVSLILAHLEASDLSAREAAPILRDWFEGMQIISRTEGSNPNA